MTSSQQKRILLLSWRDIKNPKKGGAEVVDYEILKRLAQKGYEVTWFSSKFFDCKEEEFEEGIKYIRRGTFFSVHLEAINYIKKNKGNFDFILDEYHGYPFFTNLYADTHTATIIHEVAGEIWFKMFKFPVSVVGYLFEKICLRFLKTQPIITISESTKSDLLLNKINKEKIFIIPEGTSTTPVKSLNLKKNPNQICFVGRVCKMKGVTDLLHAYSNILRRNPDIKLILAGKVDPHYKKELESVLTKLNLTDKVEITGFVSHERREQIMKESMYLVSCSVKEGWGLVVTEANVLGTPAITYNVHGYRDAVLKDKTGFLTSKNTPKFMANLVLEKLQNPLDYKQIQKNAYEFSKALTWENSTEEFEKILKTLSLQKTGKKGRIKNIFAKVIFMASKGVGQLFHFFFKFHY